MSDKTTEAECQTCKDTGMAWQWRTYGDRQYHGYYYEPCDDCARGKEIAEARRRRYLSA